MISRNNFHLNFDPQTIKIHQRTQRCWGQSTGIPLCECWPRMQSLQRCAFPSWKRTEDFVRQAVNFLLFILAWCGSYGQRSRGPDG
jgi:hypothetical protein